MHCYHCSAVADKNAAFCEKCGAQLGFTEAIIDSVINKEENAITFLYQETYNSVFRAIRPLIKDEDTALDILQDTYIKAFESIEQLEKPEQFRAWVKRIAVNKSKDWLKKKRPTLFSEMRPDDDSGEIDFLDDRELAQPDVILDKEETRRLLWEIIDSLSDEQRLVVSMYYFQEMQVKEIALELEISENTVKSRLNYARKNIESKVLVLEKQGTKLYSLAPLPFLLWLIHYTAEIPSAAALTKITSALGASGGAAATAIGVTATAAVSSGTAVGATAAGASVVTKIVAGIVAVAITVGGGIALYQAITPDDEPVKVASAFEGAWDLDDTTPETEPDFTQEPEPVLDLETLNAERIAAYVSYLESLDADGRNFFALRDCDGDGLDELLSIRRAESLTYLPEIISIDEQNNIISIFSPENYYEHGSVQKFEIISYEGNKYLSYHHNDGYSDDAGNHSRTIYQLFDVIDGKLSILHEIEYASVTGYERYAEPSITVTIDGEPMDNVEFDELKATAVKVLDNLGDNGMSQDEFISTYKNADTIPDAASDAQNNYTGFSYTNASGTASYRIDAVGEAIQLTYTVQMIEGEVAISYTIYGTRTEDIFVMERIEMNGQDMTGAFEKFDFIFFEEEVELTVKIQGYPAEGAPSDGTYILTK